MVNRLAVFVIMLALIVGIVIPIEPAVAVAPIKLVLDGRPLSSDVAPEIRNGRTLVPFRTIFEALGAQVDYDSSTNTVFGFKGPVFVILNPGKTTAWVSGKEVKLDVGPVVVNGRVLVPLRFIAESLGELVNYIGATKAVTITTTPDIRLPISTAQKEYSTVYSGEVKTMNYLTANSTADQAVGANIVDTLVEYDNYGLLRPALARYWKISADGLKYTFTLREGVKWLDYTGKEYAEVVAQDFVDSAKYILTKTNASTHANQLYADLKGARAYYDGETTDFTTVGVKAIGKYTVEYTLKEPIPYFMSKLTYVCYYPVNGKFLNAVGSRFGTDHTTLLSNGPYILTNFQSQNMREFAKNDTYWDKKNVHIEKLTYKYNKEAGTLAPELFFRGEITAASIPSDVLDAYMADPAKANQIRSGLPSSYAYWYAFNFDPKFAAEYEPENWKKAVHNLNFRKAIFHGLDRVAAMMTLDPYNPEGLITNTITPPNFASTGGKDYTQLAPLAGFSNTDTFFNRTLAQSYKSKAMAELKGTVTFPVKVMMPYNTGSTDWTNRVQVVEQQLENLLGRNFIDIIPVGYPSTGFLGATRRAHNYALQEVNWGPDFADPITYADPFAPGDPYSYTPIEDAEYQRLWDVAKNELVDLSRRYELLAQAEAYLIENALVIPYRTGGGGYLASKLDPFTAPYAPFGSSSLRFKYQVIMPKSRNAGEHNRALEQWKQDRAFALRKAGQ